MCAKVRLEVRVAFVCSRLLAVIVLFPSSPSFLFSTMNSSPFLPRLIPPDGVVAEKKKSDKSTFCCHESFSSSSRLSNVRLHATMLLHGMVGPSTPKSAFASTKSSERQKGLLTIEIKLANWGRFRLRQKNYRP